ncbi:hypothetical protein [Haliscomenobacter sp.]|uniref:hypothetical protein n=1 Tax=Haliscomenobacter sp. TaxID=2717303 RepID=UPI003BACA9C7
MKNATLEILGICTSSLLLASVVGYSLILFFRFLFVFITAIRVWIDTGLGF